VTIVDSRGRVLSKQQAESRISQKTSSQAEYQRNVETELANRIQSLLTKVVGSDNVIARVSASLDFSVREKTEEIYDAEEPALRSRHRKTERVAGSPSMGGQSTVVPTESGGANGIGSQREKTDEIVNYEVNRVVSKTIMPVGTIEKLSVAVLVDGTYVKNDKGIEEFQPRSKKEMSAMEELVKNSVGFDSRRGDQVVVTSIPFKTVDVGQGLVVEESWKRMITLLLPMVKYLISFAAILFIALFVLRPMVKSLMERGGESLLGQQRELTAAGAVNEQLSGGMGPLSLGRPESDANADVQAVKRLAGTDEQGFAELMRNWLK
jgi:flagellar M-ring protein FliF